MNLPFKADIRRADRDNTINVYISEEWEDVLQEGTWQQFFTEKPEPLTREEKKEWIAQNTKVALGSDAFFPFGEDRKSTRLNSSHANISYAVFCLKKKKRNDQI